MQPLPQLTFTTKTKTTRIKVKIWSKFIPVEEILKSQFSNIYLKKSQVAVVFIRELFQILSQKLMDNILQQKNNSMRPISNNVKGSLNLKLAKLILKRDIEANLAHKIFTKIPKQDSSQKCQ